MPLGGRGGLGAQDLAGFAPDPLCGFCLNQQGPGVIA